MGTWSSLNPPIATNFAADIALLLTDGSVLVHNDAVDTTVNPAVSHSDEWFRLAPGDDGTYTSGHWTGPLKMTYQRQAFASGVLNDGRAFVIGGEYSNDPNDLNTNGRGTFSPSAELFDPDRNEWSLSTSTERLAWAEIAGDLPACILPDGRVLVGEALTTNCWLWDPVHDSWTTAGTNFGTSANTKQCASNDEETWTLLPDGSVLTVAVTPNSPNAAQRYVPKTDAWVSAGSTPTNLVLASVLGVGVDEIGPAMTLPSGKTFFVGATGDTAIYTLPDASNPEGTWARGPTTPASGGSSPATPNLTVSDGPGALMPNGRVIFLAGTTSPIKDAQGDVIDYYSHNPVALEYDPVMTPRPTTIPLLASQPTFTDDSYTFQYWMLVLPTGELLLCEQNSPAPQIYSPDATDGSPLAGWRPAITSAPATVLGGMTITLKGTQLNGLSQACSYGDDGQMATNYPIVRAVNSTTGRVHYLKTHSFSTRAIATGTSPVSTMVDVPVAVPWGDYQMVVIANGIPSEPVDIEVIPPQPIPELDAKILVGVMQDGGGIVRIGGRLWRIPPWQPFARSVAGLQQLLIRLRAGPIGDALKSLRRP